MATPTALPQSDAGAIQTSWTKDAISFSARKQAKDLIGLLKAGESIESLRSTIAAGKDCDADVRQFRHQTLLAFDCLVARRRGHGLRKRARIVSAGLRAEVERLLRLHLSHAAVLKRLPVGPGVVAQVSKEIGASYLRPHGRGRRLTPELKEKIRAAVKARRRAADIQREFRCDYDTVQKYRHELGDFEDRRHWTKLSPEQVAQARDLLASDVTWRNTAAQLGVCLATLQRSCSFRKRAKR